MPGKEDARGIDAAASAARAVNRTEAREKLADDRPQHLLLEESSSNIEEVALQRLRACEVRVREENSALVKEDGLFLNVNI